MKLIALITLTSTLWASTAGAVTIYRCGAAGNSFSDRPCADGRSFEADDARDDAQRADAARVAALDRRLADELQAERLRAAAALPPQRAAGFQVQRSFAAAPLVLAANHPKRPSARSKQRWAYDDRETFIAFAPPAAGKPRQPR